MRAVRGALVDVDGTLLAGDDAIPGAAELLARFREQGIVYRLTTNTTRRSRAQVARVLAEAGIPVQEREVLAPSVLARRRILDSGRRRAALLVPEAARADFAGVVEEEQEPDWVVLGDLGPLFTWERLNQAFHALRNGAQLLALHKNRFWHAGARGIVLDAGGFVAALEYAASVTAELIGKPARAFYELSLSELGVPAANVLAIGDDPENDCAGPAALGCRSALVRTGKFGEELLSRSGAAPDLVVDSVASLILAR